MYSSWRDNAPNVGRVDDCGFLLLGPDYHG